MKNILTGCRIWAHPLLQSNEKEEEFHPLTEELKLYHGQIWMYF